MNLEAVTETSRVSCSKRYFFLCLPFSFPSSEDFSVTITQCAMSSNLFPVNEAQRIIGSIITRAQRAVTASDISPRSFPSKAVFESELWPRAEANDLIFFTYVTLIQFMGILVMWRKTTFLLKENEPVVELQIVLSHVPVSYRKQVSKIMTWQGYFVQGIR